ncbi:hypothetical protein CspHIS471_0104930 [Cutaneotrichosporon sp. HIS471]|nr:hypothetical protein CspHIS471_0104930 [Cutaneotrichosporon sp. HIS471]
MVTLSLFVPPLLLFALLPTALANNLWLVDGSPALLYSPSTVSPNANLANETWVDWYAAPLVSPPPAGPSDFIWGSGESTHTTSLEGASVNLTFTGTRVEWWGRVGAGTVLSTGNAEVSPIVGDGTGHAILAASDFGLGVHGVSLTLVRGKVTLTGVRLTIPTPEEEWTTQPALINNQTNPFFTAPDYTISTILAGHPWNNIRAVGMNTEPQWLNFSIPANTSAMAVTVATDPREMAFDHYLIPGGWLPRVSIRRSWSVPLTATVLFLDPAVKYKYGLFPVNPNPLKFGGVDFLSGGEPGLPVAGTSGEVGTEGARVAAQAAGAGAGSDVTGESGPGGKDTPGATAASSPDLSAKKRSNVGAIVGGVIGGVVVLALLGLGWYLRRWKRQGAQPGEKIDLAHSDEIVDNDNPVTPYWIEDKPQMHPRPHSHPLVAQIRPPRPTPTIDTNVMVPRTLSPGLEQKRELLGAPLSADPNGPGPSAVMTTSPLSSTLSSTLSSPDTADLLVHASDAGPVRVNVLPPMYDPTWSRPPPLK